jgi:hypothetical protein
MEEYSERTLDRDCIDIIGLVSPQCRTKDEDPADAMEALKTIRRLASFLKKLSFQDTQWNEDDITVMGDLADCIHVGAGHVLEYLETQVRPQFLDHSSHLVMAAGKSREIKRNATGLHKGMTDESHQ